MGVDLHRIGTGISSGTSRNGLNSIVSFPSAPSFPAYGTFNSWSYDVTYPIVNGGASVTIESIAYPSQFCDVQLKNNGAGGTYTDWTTATDVQYIPYMTSVVSITNSLYITVLGVSYDNGSSTTEYSHDGSGGLLFSVTYSYPAINLIVAGTSAYNINLSTNCNGTISATVGTITTNYYYDGGGGSYNTDPTNSYFSYGTQIYSESCDDGSGNYNNTYYYSDGAGGFYS